MSKFHARLLRLAKELPRSKSKAFIFSTSGYGKISYHDELRNILEGKEYKVVADFACKGWDTYGIFKLVGGINKKRPNEKDLYSAKEFAEKLLTGTP